MHIYHDYPKVVYFLKIFSKSNSRMETNL